MRIIADLWSAEEQARSAESQRNAKPEYAKGKFQWLTSAAAGAAALGAVTLSCGSANAGSFTPPGDTVGLAIGAPLPEGVYFVDILSDGGSRGVDDKKSGLVFNIPAVAWSTPWTIFGGRVWGYSTAPELSAGFPYCPAPACAPNPLTGGAQAYPPPVGGRDFMAMYNPLVLAGLAWDLGGSWGFSDVVGGYGPVNNELRLLGHDIWVFSNRAAISYTGNKWNLSAEVVTGVTGDDLQTHQRVQPNYLNLNLSAVKTLGKWEVGAVAFYSTDLENFAYGSPQCGGTPSLTRRCEQSQFAAGGEIGYEFPGITTLLQATTDVWTGNYRNLDGSKSYETQIWLKAIVPLWNPPKEEVSMK